MNATMTKIFRWVVATTLLLYKLNCILILYLLLCVTFHFHGCLCMCVVPDLDEHTQFISGV